VSREAVGRQCLYFFVVRRRGRLLDVFEAAVAGSRRVLHQQFWALTRDLETVALLDIARFAHTAGGKADLMEKVPHV
jgi:hypothetical protein